MGYDKRGLRKPIEHEIDGKVWRLLTIGHLAAACHRTNWTIRHWIVEGLLPEPPFVLRPETPGTRRHLYPEDFVIAVAHIIESGHYLPRVDVDRWDELQAEVFSAFDDVMGDWRTGTVVLSLQTT